MLCGRVPPFMTHAVQQDMQHGKVMDLEAHIPSVVRGGWVVSNHHWATLSLKASPARTSYSAFP